MIILPYSSLIPHCRNFCTLECPLSISQLFDLLLSKNFIHPNRCKSGPLAFLLLLPDGFRIFLHGSRLSILRFCKPNLVTIEQLSDATLPHAQAKGVGREYPSSLFFPIPLRRRRRSAIRTFLLRSITLYASFRGLGVLSYRLV